MNRQNEAGTKKRKAAVLVAAVGLPLIAWILFEQFFLDLSSQPITVTGTIEAKEIPLASKVGGRLSKVFVSEGEYLKKGQTLVEFDLAELEAKRLQILASVEKSQAQLLELKNGPRIQEINRAKAAAQGASARHKMLSSGYRKEDIARAKAQAEEAKANYQLAQSGFRKEEIEQAKQQLEQAKVQCEWLKADYLRYKQLAAQGAVSNRDADSVKKELDGASALLNASQQHYDKLRGGVRPQELAAAKERLNHAEQNLKMMLAGPRQEEIESARKDYDQAMASLNLLKEGTRYEQLRKAEADLRMSEGQLAEIDAQLMDRKISAPADAEVSIMDLHEGEFIAAGKTLATLTRLDDLWTRVYLPERQLARVRPMQNVKVRCDAYPDKVFAGTIVQIPSRAEFTPRNVQTPEERSAQVFGIKVKIDNSQRLLRGGMNAEIVLPAVESPWTKLAGIVR